jgi:hypothetical protein
MDEGDLLSWGRTIGFSVITLLLLASAGYGRVFLRSPGRSDVTANLERLGGAVAYSSTIRINGGDGRLTILSFDDSVADSLASVRRVLDLPADRGSEHSSLHIIRGDNATVRLLLLRLKAHARILAICIEQPNAEFEASEEVPREHTLRDIAPFPGSQPSFYAEDVNTGVQLGVSETPAPASAVLAFYGQELRTKGWEATLSDNRGAVGGVPFYVRHGEVCCLHVSDAETRDRRRITVLHKKLGNSSPLK